MSKCAQKWQNPEWRDYIRSPNAQPSKSKVTTKAPGPVMVVYTLVHHLHLTYNGILHRSTYGIGQRE